MKPYYFIFLSILLLTPIFSFDDINTLETQRRSRKITKKNKGKIITNTFKKYPAEFRSKNAKRSLDDDGDDSEDIVFSYDRCDHGHTPDDLSDCTKYRTNTSACCMFTYGVDSGCVLIGFQYLGTKTLGDMTVECAQSFLDNGLKRALILLLSLILL